MIKKILNEWIFLCEPLDKYISEQAFLRQEKNIIQLKFLNLMNDLSFNG